MSIIDYAASGNNSINGINIATGCNPANVDNALRALTDDLGGALRTGYFATALPSTKSAGYAVLTSDRGKLFNCTATLTLTLPAAATAEAGFMFYVKANGAAVTIDPNGAELIDGAATVVIASGSNAVVACTGTAWITAFGVVPYDWAAAVVAASAKATPIDADSIGIVDSAAANVLKETTIGELKAVVLASSALTGTPTAPTAATTTNTTQVASTAFVQQEITAIDHGAAAAALSYGGIGTYVFGYVSTTGITENTTIAGSNIEPAGVQESGVTGSVADDTLTGGSLVKGGSALSGTWRIMGRANAVSGSARVRVTLFLRIS
jgi:hypothetical protein